MKAIELLHGYPPAVSMLGEPIRTRKLDLGDTTTTYSDGLNARVCYLHVILRAILKSYLRLSYSNFFLKLKLIKLKFPILFIA